MADTTFEEAKRCPKCEMPGDDRSATASKDSRGKPVTVHLIYCVNDECRWYNTPWTVQVNADGSIPKPHSALGRKQFPSVSPEMQSKIEENIQRQIQQETQPGGGEIRNPFG